MASRYSDHRRYLELGKSGSHSYQTPHSHSALAGDVASLPCKWRWVAVCVTALPEAHQQLSIYCSTFTYQSCVNFLWHLLFCTSLEGKNKQIMLSVFEFIFNYYVASFKYCLSGLKKKKQKNPKQNKKKHFPRTGHKRNRYFVLEAEDSQQVNNQTSANTTSKAAVSSLLKVTFFKVSRPPLTTSTHRHKTKINKQGAKEERFPI